MTIHGITNLEFEYKSSPSSRWVCFTVSGDYRGHTFIQTEIQKLSNQARHDIDLVCETMKIRLIKRVKEAIAEALCNYEF